MKKMKRTWAILLALVLTVALAVPGFAAEGVYSITITNEKAGHTYEPSIKSASCSRAAFKLFSATTSAAIAWSSSWRATAPS